MSPPGTNRLPPTSPVEKPIAKREKRYRRRLALLLALLLILVPAQACRPTPVAPPARPDSPTPNGPTETPVPGSTATHTPSPEPTLTRPLPSPTPRPITSTPTPPVEPVCLQAGGTVQRHQLYTELSSWPWEFRVYRPPCYEEEPLRYYPTLYLVHGSTFTDAQWDRLGADEAADRLIAAGEIPPLLIVMPRDRRWVEPTEDPFGEAVVDHILPWVEANYRAIPGREHRAIGGLSRGAAWAVHLGLSRWELFSAIGAHSLPVFWSDTGRVRGWLADIPVAELPRIYLDIGESDYLIESAVWFEGVLEELDIPHEWHLYPGRHEEAYWAEHLEEYLRWYAAAW